MHKCKTPGCKGRVDIYYDYEALKEIFTKEELAKRRGGVWKYFELLPVKDRKNIVTLGEGGTQLIKAKRLADYLGTKNLFMKDESRNPSGSFKDRPLTVGVSKAVEFGVKTLTIASSGNAAAALATYAAKAGIEAVTFVPAFAPSGKIYQLLLLGAKVVRLTGWKGGVDPTVKLMRESAEKYGWIECPSFGTFNMWQFEGNKTIGYELAEQFNYDMPDWLFIQVGAAALLGGVYKGIREFYDMGLINKMPKIVAVQSEGNAPFVRAWKKGMTPPNIEPWDHPETIAEGLEDPYPWDADMGIKALRDTKGDAVAVTDRRIADAEKLLAKYEGLFIEPSGATGLAGLMQFLEEGIVDREDRIAILLTGSGFKDPDIIQNWFKMPPVIQPEIDALEKVFPELKEIKNTPK